MEKEKAPVLWTIQYEEVDESERKHRGMIRDTKATLRNEWQQKGVRNDEVMALNVNQRFEDGTQKEKQKIKSLPSIFKINRFHWMLKINRVLNWRILIK